MADNIRLGLDNPHPFSQMKTKLIWEGKYDEYGNWRTVDIVEASNRLISPTFCSLIYICFSSSRNH